MSDSIRVLIVDDTPSDAKLIARELRHTWRDLEFEVVEEATTMRTALESGDWDVVLSDWSMPKFTAQEAIRVLHAAGKDLPFIIVSGTIGEETAVEAMRHGAHDYVVKDRLARLGPAVEREMRFAAMRAANRGADEKLRRIEEQLRQAQKMEAVGSLAGGIAHDFNNLLSVILSYSHMLAADMSEGDPMRESVGEIRFAAERAADLTRQLLAFSRHQILQTQVLDPNDVIARAERMLRRVQGEDIVLSIIRAPSVGAVRADRGQLEQLLMNLVVNSRDAMPEGGKLTIETASVTLDDSYAADHIGVVPGPHVMLAVTDTGAGMDQATQARIFEPFFTTKDVGKGTGLGLSTVFGIVQQSGGSVWVYSEVGRGTTFKIYLPVVAGDARTEELLEPQPVTTLDGSETILLVEDEERVRNLARTILRRHGYHVLEATGGGDALLICEQHPATIHLLLTDVVMPRMSGRQLAERLAPMRPKMKVLFMSGYTANAMINHGVLESPTAFVQKPLTPEALAVAVRRTLDAPS